MSATQTQKRLCFYECGGLMNLTFSQKVEVCNSFYDFKSSCEQSNGGYAIAYPEALLFCDDLKNYDNLEEWNSACEQFGSGFMSASCSGFENAGDDYTFFYDEIMNNNELAPYYSSANIPYIHEEEVSPTVSFFNDISTENVFLTFVNSVSFVLPVILIFIAVCLGIKKVIDYIEIN